MAMNEEAETYAVSIITGVVAGAGGVGLGLLAIKKSVKLPAIGTISPAVLGTGLVAALGFAAYGIARYAGKGRREYELPGKAALYAGVAGLGAFAAAVASSKYVESKTGVATKASFGEGSFEGEESFEGSGTVPQPRILGEGSYSDFTGPAQPAISPTYYVTVMD